MDNMRSSIKLIGIAAGVVLLVIVIVVASFSKRPATPTAIEDPQKLTAITSPFTQATENLEVNYGGTIDPNHDAAVTPLRIFALDSLGLPQGINDRLTTILTAAVTQEQLPTYASTYIQIDRPTVACDTEYDCAFSFYLDSPESYYKFRQTRTAGGAPVITVTQQPLPGEQL